MTAKWTETKTWNLITQIKLSENFKVLYGQAANENSSGDTKHAIHQRIATSLWPGDGDMTKLAFRIKNRITWLETKSKEKVKLSKKTGEGVEEWYQISPSSLILICNTNLVSPRLTLIRLCSRGMFRNTNPERSWTAQRTDSEPSEQ